MRKSNVFLRLCALSLTLLFSLPFLASCVQDETVIGSVNGRDVYYDELYFLVSSYKNSVSEKCGDDKALVQAELDRLVKENITANYAMLELCERHGLEYKSIKDQLDKELNTFIEENFNGKKSEFRENCKEFGISERYVRYTLGIQLLYEQLPSIYIKEKLVETDEENIIKYIKENFIRVNHLVLFNDEGDDVDANKEKIEEAQKLLNSGEKINTLIGKGYSEDFGDPDASGYYITKGTMVEEYEKAAFSLKVGEYSEIIPAYSENNSGEYVSCYYIIQRLDLSDEYIDTYYTDLKNDYYNSVIYSDLEELEKTLKFVPNEKYKKLDLTELPKSTNLTLTIIISAIAIIFIAALVAVFIIKHNLNKKNLSYQAKHHRRKK